MPDVAIRLLDLDGSVVRQPRLARLASQIIPLSSWGPRLRIACRWSSFERFEVTLARQLGRTWDQWPLLTFLGSGDFHHLTLASLRRLGRNCNLLLLDNHPDWMRGVPFLHCGTWLYHAARLPWIHRIFHVGGMVDFDNHYRWLAPWELLRSGKIVVFPGASPFHRGGWSAIPHTPLRALPDQQVTAARLAELLAPWRKELADLPLYVSLDRDVLAAEYSQVNWDSGCLTPTEVLEVVEEFVKASAGLHGIDVVGDWSPIRVTGAFRRLLDWVEHPRLHVDELAAQEINEAFNLALVEVASMATV